MYSVYIYKGKRIVRNKKGSSVYSKDFLDGTLIQHLHTTPVKKLKQFICRRANTERKKRIYYYNY